MNEGAKVIGTFDGPTARELWLADHGLAADAATLIGDRNEVLRNRLALAFDAGWDAAKERFSRPHEIVSVTAARVIIEVSR